MEITALQMLFARHRGVKALGRAIVAGDNFAVRGLQGSAPAMVFAALPVAVPEAAKRVFLFVIDGMEEAAYFYNDLSQILGTGHVLFFPSSYRRAVKHGQRDAANEVLRTDTLTRLANVRGDEMLYIVTSPDALAERVASKKTMSERSAHVAVGDTIPITSLEDRLAEIGFRRRDYVYEPGDFAVRGSIVDVYSYADERPLRIDFFGDEIDSIRTFDVDTQLSRDKMREASLIPATQSDAVAGGSPFTDFLPVNAVVVSRGVKEVSERVQGVFDEGFSLAARIENQARGERELPAAAQLLIRREEIEEGLSRFMEIAIQPAASGAGRKGVVSFDNTPQPITHKNFDLTVQLFGQYMVQGYKLYILADSEKQTARLKAVFDEKGHTEADHIVFTPVNKTLHEGFADDTLKVCLFTDHQIFDRFHRYSLRSEQALSGRVALTLKELQQFEVGDFVVHIDHGVGRFGGLMRLPQSDGSTQEVIKITYAHDDTVFVSIHSLHKVSKYKGKEGEPPRLSSLGTGAWERMKERTKAHLKDIARDLIQLYGKRSRQKGFAFSPDSFMQHELEASFIYEDTPDQFKATEDVKRDMEAQKPMDRLVCGDVGFGKTEVAIRAAFKAAADNKQVAIMVPTTVLAYQHYNTFTSRLKDMPVRIEYLSRARSAAKTKAILDGLADGSVNIVIGTQKLLGKTVKFKDLGLLIIDEEQKFGVSTKEKLRQMKTDVDTLTLTATPIPRTLQFSLMGARDLSVIQTPPPNRYPIQTEVHTFDADIIAEAINFEMSRGGQVYIVNHRISGLYELESVVRRCVPDARIATGHGKMSPEDLEKVVLDFANYEYDVLISTTIIESGIDIPNANTIIINGANHFGLSDLHQMRGRVGRSNKKAFCYLLAPPLGSLPEDARRRLQAIENFAHLGSGIHIAMQDLDIRGAGNLLGAEQSGFIANLGYEAYQKILAEAMRELKREEEEKSIGSGRQEAAPDIRHSLAWVDECQLESDLPLFFSEDFVPTSSERMLLYRELDNITDDNQLDRFRERLVDRFGNPPVEAEELMRVSPLKRLGVEMGCDRIVLKNKRMRMFFTADERTSFYQSDVFGQCITFATMHVTRTTMAEVNGRRLMTIKNVPTVSAAVEILSQIKNIKP